MKKDVIYIDVDDDVTAIIGKIKKANEKVVALVPPKRAGALQSAVNLRLLDRMAKAEKKQLVLVTHNPALVALAASNKMPVAKTLQSKPELAEVPALVVDDDDDIIDGAELPVGEHAKNTIPVNDSTKEFRSDAIDDVEMDIDDVPVKSTPVTEKKKTTKSKSKVPNFNTFRKKLFFGIGGGIALAALLVWMFVFAPAATIIITARTTPSPVSVTVKLDETAATSYQDGILRASIQQEKVDETIEFTATGEDNVGDKATGTAELSTNSISLLGSTIAAGTALTTSGGYTFYTDESVTITFDNYSGQSVGVTASESGAAYNGLSGKLSGAPSGVSASLSGATSGGTDKIAKVVTASDIELAKGNLIGQSTDKQKAKLAAAFANGEVVVSDSFTVSRGSETASPAVGEEASDGKAKLTIPTTYTMYAVPSTDLDGYLTKYLEQQLSDSQKVYDTGADSATISGFKKSDDAATAIINAKGQVGPEINEDAIKEQSKGKIYGEVKSTLKAQDGISSVDVKFSYFWVRSVPNNVDKIQVEFKVADE